MGVIIGSDQLRAVLVQAALQGSDTLGQRSYHLPEPARSREKQATCYTITITMLASTVHAPSCQDLLQQARWPYHTQE